MKNLKMIAVIMALILLSLEGINAQSVTPSKKYITKELSNIKEFSSIVTLGSPDVEYRQSKDNQTTVSLYGSDNLLNLVQVTSANGVLTVNIKKNVRINSGERRLKVIASSPSLKGVNVRSSSDISLKGQLTGTNLNLTIVGSGDIEADNLQYSAINVIVKGSGDVELKKVKSTSVKAQVSGSGDISIKGDTQNASLTVNGSGDIGASKLTASDVIATVSGSGDISCYASNKLDAKASGSGDISYKGKPAVVNKQGKKNSITAD